ncbi:probable sodium/potassium/calcium exchanger CG1090 [Mytilus edulis]|uniref:probable sodium/potassium/calcium exchanger CG1090 n=1 Tax=Mytilus edulis TaxID=6550 RepID=UPI0039EE5396
MGKTSAFVKFSLFGLAMISLTLWKNNKVIEDEIDWNTSKQLRHLTSLPNCTPRAITQFPHGMFTQEQRVHGAVVINILIAVYMFLGFAIICDDYFVPSLEIMCDVLHIQSDVAGATLMAAGSSAPELATAVIAVFIAKDDIGLGTVVGSAVYNVMFVISICALFAGMVVHLNWWPLFRDCAFYTLSVLALAYVIYDENVYWYESLGLVIFYIFYIVLMFFNSKLEVWMVEHCKCLCSSVHHKQGIKHNNTIVHYDKLSESVTSNGSITSTKHRHYDVESDSQGSEVDADDVDHYDEPLMSNIEEPESVFALPNVWYKKILWTSSLPLKFVFFISVPDCRQQRWKKYFFITFFMSLFWLTALSYLMVWMITIIGFTVNLPDTVMALTFVAFGVSLPDVISSLIVVREGYGDMAVSNAVGSNVFDILICMGVPWVLKSAINDGAPIKVYSEGLLYSTLTLLGTVVFLLAATHVNGWKLTKKYGIVLMIVYLIFTVLTALYELNVFGYVHPKECKTNY